VASSIVAGAREVDGVEDSAQLGLRGLLDQLPQACHGARQVRCLLESLGGLSLAQLAACAALQSPLTSQFYTGMSIVYAGLQA
jgi:hypothetical protein